MDFSNLFVRVLELSPFVAALLYFLFTVWNTMQKERGVLTDTFKEHSSQMLSMQRESITAQNNSADANRQLAGALDKMCDKQDDMGDKLDDIRDRLPRSKTSRIMTDTSKPAVA